MFELGRISLRVEIVDLYRLTTISEVTLLRAKGCRWELPYPKRRLLDDVNLGTKRRTRSHPGVAATINLDHQLSVAQPV